MPYEKLPLNAPASDERITPMNLAGVPVEPVKKPIFFAATRSFIFGILPAVLTFADWLFGVFVGAGANPPVAQFIAMLIGWPFGWTPEQVHAFMVQAAPVYAFIVAQQRSGASRPYTFDLRKFSIRDLLK